MTTLTEQIETSLPLDEAFAFVADFANAVHWDPGVAASERIGSGPVEVGARYRLKVRMAGRSAPMEYVVTDFEPGRRVVLAGEGSGVTAVDDIRFEATPAGTRIHYNADIRLRGLMRLFEPFAGGSFEKIGRNAREGMTRALEARSAAR